jgi:transcriptional regulator with XRE-family HTH domain
MDWLGGFLAHMGWTHRDLGAAVGKDRVTVSRWLHGHTYPDRDTRMLLNDLARGEGFDAIPRKWETRRCVDVYAEVNGQYIREVCQ